MHLRLDDTPSPPPPPRRPERRRPGWREFRRAYPGIVVVAAIAIVVLLVGDAWLLARRWRYQQEITRLRADMTSAERQRADLVLAADGNRFRVMLELIRRQARIDKELHLSIVADSGRMYLEREGALLRDMPVQVGAEKTVGEPPDTVRMAVPRGSRTIEAVLGAGEAWEVPAWVFRDRGLPVPEDRRLAGALGPVAIVLTGGTVVYSVPDTGPLSDSGYVLPGSVRARAADLAAIAPNLAPGMSVYLY